MKMLKEGTNNQVTCRSGCGSLMEFTPADVKLQYKPINVGPHEIECMPSEEDHYQAQVTCMKCGATLLVSISRELKRAKLAERARHYD